VNRPVLLLSDLHLPPAASPLRDAFLGFCSGPAQSASAVYILGDLFDYWIGDASGLRDYAPEARALHELARRGVRPHFMHGNRDFLLGGAFARAAGLQLLDDPSVVDLCGTRTLLAHGDQFCTDDLDYQRWRRFSRNRYAQAAFHLLPERARQAIAGRARGASETGKRSKPEAIMDVNDEAVRNAFRRYGVRRMIHGHTHRPAEHSHDLDGARAERIVLADWRPERMEYLEYDAAGPRRVRLGGYLAAGPGAG
jgi:UDP-2,3-diacylglucosamine hydrolase